MDLGNENSRLKLETRNIQHLGQFYLEERVQEKGELGRAVAKICSTKPHWKGHLVG